MSRITTFVTAIAVLLGLALGTAASATAQPADTRTASAVRPDAAPRVTAGCASGRCTVYLSNAETRALGAGRVPTPPAFVAGPLRVAYYALAYGHRWFAQQYGARGLCSAFRLSIYPWESQGFMSRRC